MDINDLLMETSSLTATYKNYKFKLEVFTEKLTPAYKAKLLALTRVNDDHDQDAPAEVKDENAQMLADLISAWTDEKDEPIVLKGEPFPPTYENFLSLSYPLMAALIKQITTFLGDLANPQSAPTSPAS